MIPYPETLPTDALMTLLDVVRGKTDASKAVHAAWNVLGYGLAQGFPVQQGIGDHSDAATVEALEALIAHEASQQEHPGTMGFPSVAFAIALKLALKLVLSALS